MENGNTIRTTKTGGSRNSSSEGKSTTGTVDHLGGHRKKGDQLEKSLGDGRISFLLRATYDVLPSPTNLQQWLGEDPSCPLCSSPATLRHIITDCKVSFSQGRYTWRHNQVLKCLAAAIELKRTSTISTPLITSTKEMLFIRAGEQGQRRAISLVKIGQLEGARDWKMLADVGQRLTVPVEIVCHGSLIHCFLLVPCYCCDVCVCVCV